MSAGRRYALIAAGAAGVWYVCIVIFWALQPLTDAVPVGVDYTVSPPAFVSVTVTCNDVFANAARDDSPLPPLKVQPAGAPPLAYQRAPCVIPHRQARIVFALDTVVFAAVVACSLWLALRRRPSPAPQPANNAGLVGSRAG